MSITCDYLRLLSNAKTAARQAGRTVTERTLKRWPPSGRAFPSKKSLAQLEAAYLQVRRHSVARHLLQRLNRDGRGTRVEFHPPSQSRVSRPHHGAVIRTFKPEIAAPGVDISAAMDDAAGAGAGSTASLSISDSVTAPMSTSPS
ncbi:hypothetical protein [Streptomyces sp. NPDC058247]|uniref:hypothetical protein n=1 Tax=Streptomyces sp. NPDC058247 TaxID=3346401 RepID=UPI0036EB8743